MIMQHEHHRPFHDYSHARQYDRVASQSDFRAQLAEKLRDLLELSGSESVLDIATGTGRFVSPIAERLTRGAVFGIDGAEAMLRVGREEIEKALFARYFQIIGVAQTLPFAPETFDRAFVAFAFHHFGGPAEGIVREAHRVLKPGGRFVILDPVFQEARDPVDHAVHNIVHRAFRRVHGEQFRFYSTAEIQKILQNGAAWKATFAEIQRLSFDQKTPEGIPTARHWVDAAAELESQPDDVKRRFEENYFRCIKEGEDYRITGSLNYAIVWSTK
jgi:ubiquinone/menaquinone biosynthesis C-methylase UbiE